MTTTIVLYYRRSQGDLSTGWLSVLQGEAKSGLVVDSFENVAFVAMLKKFATRLRECKATHARFIRTDRENMAPFDLPADEVKLFHEDPAAAIRQHLFEPIIVRVGDPAPRAKEPVTPLLDAGYETVGESFGDLVYARCRARDISEHYKHEVECVCCGEWSPVGVFYVCGGCKATLRVADNKFDLGWAGFYMPRVLDVDTDKFFLPRRWNKNGNWITKEELKKLFENYLKEKSS